MDAKYLSDAAHFPGGHAAAIAIPRSPVEVPAIVRGARTLLAVGAQSSLTGGATPMGEVLLSTEKLNRILEIGPGRIRVEAGVSVAAMQEALAREGAWFPPAPTFTGAFAGGIVATNAAGAATFRHGPVRPWVQALTVVLADGTQLDVRRGGARAAALVPLPTYRMPDVVKVSAGYFSAPDMDLIDLFIGSEGTLGVITTVTFRTLSPMPTSALAFVPCPSEREALALVADLRREPAVAAIEHVDRRCLEILHEDGADRRCDVRVPSGTDLALLVQLELPPGTTAAEAFSQIEDSLGGGDTALGRVCRLLHAHGVFDATEMALPGQVRRAEQLIALREAVPAGVNQRVGRAQQTIDPRIAKTAADMIVPFERFGEMMRIYRDGFGSRGLDFAVWGHISDGNVHPNVLPRSYEDVERGKDAILFFGREAARLGGCPLAEHGVGRNPVKQALLRGLYGEDGIDQMRAIKRALDPDWKLAPGVIFPRA
ncbi:MAG TPA: FAD-binding oxidoreductase [Vicinamibacterales bacterium]|nr:FAD-binding oxidoreductase [Vicinamibacterales bacterium]